MSRLADYMAQKRADNANYKFLIPYLTAGDSNPNMTVPLMHSMVEAGADIVEVGVPFSDPQADGPAIQRACERALAHKTSLRDVLGMVREFREKNDTTPVVLMGYLNPVERMGYAEFAEQAKAVGVDGVLLVDLPPEEAEQVLPAFAAGALDPIFLLSPTTTPERMQKICALAGGYVYYVSFKGVTGAQQLNVAEVASRLDELRKHTELPIGVGFGISNAATAKAVASVADAVVVGSVLVNQIGAAESLATAQAGVRQTLAEMRVALDELAD